MKSAEEQLKIIKRGTVDIISEEELSQKLKKSLRDKRPLCIKAGFDPTAPDIHLGHTVLLNKLRQFQELGHTVYFLIGDFTARIGDPSGRTQVRKPMGRVEIVKNALTYKRQVGKILDLRKTKVVFNSRWFERMRLADFLRLTMKVTVSQMIARQDFKKRLENNQDVSLLEFMYPVLQGYDSVVVRSDIELGGTDQIFNLLVGRDLQKDFAQEPQVVITLPLLEGTDGLQKMSKSLGNYISINDKPGEIFGKIMSIPDELMHKYYTLLTDEDLEQIKRQHPKESKEKLGKLIVSRYYSQRSAQACAEEFKRVFTQRSIPEEVEAITLDANTSILQSMSAAKVVKSKNEGRRLIRQNAVEFDGKKVTDENMLITQPGILKVGSRQFRRIVIKKKSST
ncbi:MAG: tyrosine--tRNA ligase [Candidatus Omnitrophota bacterium]|jgi:tyrosyl-tRNA synthetase|nr:MAG: tyrosine--tRNA ligase [Candidatus Omnitrophota bacterium]